MQDAPACYCGKRGCMEVWCSGTGLAADFSRHPLRPAHMTPASGLCATGTSPSNASHEGEADLSMSAMEIAASNEPGAIAAMDRLVDRLARGLAVVCNIVDPDVIVLGGGVSNVARLYRDLPALVEHYAFTLEAPPRIVKNRHGDSSGVRGAAWLWPG